MENQLQKNIDCIWEFVQGCNDTSSGDGCKGPKGDKGDPGNSAYQIFLYAGNKPTEADFLNSLKGKDAKVGNFRINSEGNLIYTAEEE